ncbi:hypothetical protein C362_05393 [Cryptococcus neoformans Bt1]|nr:hypothetical protein C362_05393 [Cryptococcus neoformans var. grubii Bt1]OWZ76321.1 hypothetical protein C365_05141 [Cryptococcus neoformans var. grubii Bt85]OXG17556.1 hypothetical protein C367_05043 [Cryptococcus neoformans var. grubii Ze90-1]
MAITTTKIVATEFAHPLTTPRSLPFTEMRLFCWRKSPDSMILSHYNLSSGQRTADGIDTDSNGLTCIEPSAWDTILKVMIALMITELVVGITFMCIRSKRHRVDHEHGTVHAYKGWLKRKLKRKGHVK